MPKLTIELDERVQLCTEHWSRWSPNDPSWASGDSPVTRRCVSTIRQPPGMGGCPGSEAWSDEATFHEGSCVQHGTGQEKMERKHEGRGMITVRHIAIKVSFKAMIPMLPIEILTRYLENRDPCPAILSSINIVSLYPRLTTFTFQNGWLLVGKCEAGRTLRPLGF